MSRNVMSRKKWVDRIAAAWREQVPSIFETGNLLEAAKIELDRGEWVVMVKEELPFDRTTAHRLIAIADNDNLRNVAHVQRLPGSWGTLYELTKLTDEQFAAGIKSGTINPKMQRKDVTVLRGIKPKPPKKKDEVPRRAWSVDRVHMWLRNIALEALDDLKQSEWPELIATLRDEVSAIEKIAVEKGHLNAA